MNTKVIFKQNKNEVFAVFFGIERNKYNCFSFTEMNHFEPDATYIRQAKTYKGDVSKFVNTLQNIGYKDIKVMDKMNYKA